MLLGCEVEAATEVDACVGAFEGGGPFDVGTGAADAVGPLTSLVYLVRSEASV